jgi:hypothetical protein
MILAGIEGTALALVVAGAVGAMLLVLGAALMARRSRPQEERGVAHLRRPRSGRPTPL